MIILNKELNTATRNGILEIYENMVGNDDIDQLDYVKKKIFQKIAVLQNSSIEMERFVCAYARIIYELLVYETNGKAYKNHHKCMLSALYYFCDPFDYIPDLSPEDAYLDDAMVINQCLSTVKEQSRETYRRIKNYIRDSNI